MKGVLSSRGSSATPRRRRPRGGPCRTRCAGQARRTGRQGTRPCGSGAPRPPVRRRPRGRR
eukprot:5971487-Heterocapsa_arctica.AAC.1